MADHEAVIVVDLGFGDSGKGSLVDFLTRQRGAHTVVRFNGGAQAAHNVVTPDGRHHTFAQFGSGTFVSGVQTYLSRFMLIEPYALFNEESHLRALGIPDALARHSIDRRALVITPYQQVANRLRERARGADRHGSCGVGVGETVADFLRAPADSLYAGDFTDSSALLRKLHRVREAKRAEVEPLLPALREIDATREELAVFDDLDIIDAAAENYAYLAERARLTDESGWQALLHEPGGLIFEGAQGVLLDEDYGFAPYTSWSKTTFDNALALLDGYAGQVTRLGVLRTYVTRHGAGPFVTEDAALRLPEAHNTTSPWQREFRLGHFDLVAARYALEAAGGADVLALTHLDRLSALPEWKLCESYRFDGAPDGFFAPDGHAITVRRPPDWDSQQELTRWLWRCTPRYSTLPRSSPESYIAALESALGLPTAITSHGATALDKQIRKDF